MTTTYSPPLLSLPESKRKHWFYELVHLQDRYQADGMKRLTMLFQSRFAVAQKARIEFADIYALEREGISGGWLDELEPLLKGAN